MAYPVSGESIALPEGGEDAVAQPGQAVGGAMVLAGVVMAVWVEPVDGVWIGIVGLFLFSMARSSYPR